MPHKNEISVLFPLLCSEWASGSYPLCYKGFCENHTGHDFRGRNSLCAMGFATAVHLPAYLICYSGMVLPGMHSHCSEIHFSWLISFPQWHLLSEVSAEIKQLSWIISDLHISVNHLTQRSRQNIQNINQLQWDLLLFVEQRCFNIFENQANLGNWTTDMSLKPMFGFQFFKFWPSLILTEEKKSGKNQ